VAVDHFIGYGEGLPDVAVVRGTLEDYRKEHPFSAELVVEVAVATLELDRDKAELYAAAGVPEYWIVVPEERAVEVFCDPSPSGYRSSVRPAAPDALLRWTRLPEIAVRAASLFD
jgi:Uma2 family endonuclease